jgi:hypothetical protein
MLPLLASAALSAAACGGSSVQVLSSTTSPSSTTSTPNAPMSAPRQFRGAIERIDAATRVIVVAGLSVSVPASATIDDSAGNAIAFSALQVGDIVSISAMVADGSVTATTVTVDSPAPAPAPSPSTVTLSGRVAAVSGACPSLTFAVSDTTVTTSSSTAVTGGSCTDIVDGADVQVTGTRQDDRSVAASQVVIRAAGSR